MPFAPLRPVRDLADVRAIEATPLAEACPARSTYDIFVESARAFGDAPALAFLRSGDPDDAPIRWSYAALLANITRAANAFHALGVRPGDAVAFLLPGCLEAHLALWGGEAAGITQPLNPLLSEDRLAELLRAGNARLLIAWGEDAEAGYWTKAEALAQDVETITRLIRVSPSQALGGAPETPPAGVLDLHALIAAQPGDRLVSGRNILPSDTAAYFHTGGTTGAPKLARHTHAGQVFSAWGAVQMQGAKPGDVAINGYPLFHVAGVLPGSLASLSAGVEMVIPTTTLLRNREVMRNYWRLVERHRAATLSAVPTVLAALANVPLDGADISSIRYCRTGAAPLPRELAERFERITGLHVHESLGMTEMHGISTIRPPGVRAPAGCVGLPLPHARLRIARIDAEGRATRHEVAPGEPGMILFKSPNVFPGYLDEAANAGVFDPEGWLITGDVGRVDDLGMLHLTGRAKDLIIRSGHNIDPRSIEEPLTAHPKVQIAAAVGAPDAYAGEVPVAFATLEPGADITEAALLDWLRDAVDEPPARPRWLAILPEMPVTNVGKIFKPELRRLALERVIRDALAGIAAARGVAPPGFTVSGDNMVALHAGQPLRGDLAAFLDALPTRTGLAPGGDVP